MSMSRKKPEVTCALPANQSEPCVGAFRNKIEMDVDVVLWLMIVTRLFLKQSLTVNTHTRDKVKTRSKNTQSKRALHFNEQNLNLNNQPYYVLYYTQKLCSACATLPKTGGEMLSVVVHCSKVTQICPLIWFFKLIKVKRTAFWWLFGQCFD